MIKFFQKLFKSSPKKEQSSTNDVFRNDKEKTEKRNSEEVDDFFPAFDAKTAPTLNAAKSFDNLAKTEILENTAHKHRSNVRQQKVRPPTQFGRSKILGGDSIATPPIEHKKSSSLSNKSVESSPLLKNSSPKKSPSSTTTTTTRNKSGETTPEIKSHNGERSPSLNKSSESLVSNKSVELSSPIPVPVKRNIKRLDSNSEGEQNIKQPVTPESPIKISSSPTIKLIPSPRTSPKPVPRRSLNNEHKRSTDSLDNKTGDQISNSKKLEMVENQLNTSHTVVVKRSQTTKPIKNTHTPIATHERRKSFGEEEEDIALMEELKNDMNVKNISNKKSNGEKSQIDRKNSDEKNKEKIDEEKEVIEEKPTENVTNNNKNPVLTKTESLQNNKNVDEENLPSVVRRTKSVSQTNNDSKEGPSWIAMAEKRKSQWKDPNESPIIDTKAPTSISPKISKKDDHQSTAAPWVSLAEKRHSSWKDPEEISTPPTTSKVVAKKDDDNKSADSPVLVKKVEKKPIVNKPKPSFVPKDSKKEAIFDKDVPESGIVRPSDLLKRRSGSTNSSNENVNAQQNTVQDKSDKENKPKESTETTTQEEPKAKPKSSVYNMTRKWESGVR